mmetsp:Transcript_26615/g.61166  ORF Transcript_26615/g.61166 Transcript_26615/m.61166 type:complete len:262 (-) Transcript_26615:48-833(-)
MIGTLRCIAAGGQGHRSAIVASRSRSVATCSLVGPLSQETAAYRQGQSALVISQSRQSLFPLVAQHDDIQDIDACRWTLSCVNERLQATLASATSAEDQEAPMQDIRKCLLAMRFLKDLEHSVEKLSNDGMGPCAVELFERPWVVLCESDMSPTRIPGFRRKRQQEILRLVPRPDSLVKRAAMAALGPLVLPIGALAYYMRNGAADGTAACKWYIRCVLEHPCKVNLDRGYKVDLSSTTGLSALATSSISELVHGQLHELA